MDWRIIGLRKAPRRRGFREDTKLRQSELSEVPAVIRTRRPEAVAPPCLPRPFPSGPGRNSAIPRAVEFAWKPDPKSPDPHAPRPPVKISLLRIGGADLLHLPGEPFVEYQIYAQSLRTDRFLAVAGYGDGGPGYICTDAAFGEGGYEPTASRVGPPSESRLKAAIAELPMLP